MPDFFDEVMGTPAGPASPAPSRLPSPTNQPTDFFSQVQGIPRQSPVVGAQPIPTFQDDTPSWWDKNGRMIEGAAAGGLALLFGPKILKGLGGVVSKTGVIGET